MNAPLEQRSADVELVRRVFAGELDAYGELVWRHHAQIRGLCVSMLRDAAAAEDAAQEIFIKAYKSLEKFQSGSAFGTWACRIASNYRLDALHPAPKPSAADSERFARVVMARL